MSQGARFTIERELGHGGEGRVFAVRDAARAGAVVALKEAHGSFGQALTREFERLATLKHRHLAEVFEYFASSPLGGPHAAYTQAFVPGDDLYRTLRLHPELAEALVGQLLAALAQLHAAGLVHLDLKPDNVLVELDASSTDAPREPRARLVDFGVAARVGTWPDSVRGSRSYVAPEVMAGGVVAPGADLFGLGVCLAEVALGSLARARELAEREPAARLEALRAAGLSAALAELTSALIEPDAARRPRTAFEAARLFSGTRQHALELVTPASATGLARSGGLVARDAERELVLSATAQGRVIGIAGPPASGRTALLEGALREAQLRGVAAEAWPLSDAAATTAGFALAIARLAPGADVSNLEPVAPDASSPERWTAALDAAARDTLAALTRAPRHGAAALFVRHPESAPAPVRAFLTAARAFEGPLPLALVVGLEGPGRAGDVTLGPVGIDAVRAFVASRFGVGVGADDGLVSALAAASGGLLGHLEALLELLIARGALRLSGQGWAFVGDASALALPPDRREAIAGRIALCAPLEREVLAAIASLCTWPRTLSARVVELAVDGRAAEAIDDLVAAGLVRRDVAGELALGHAALAELVPVARFDDATRRRLLACDALPELTRARLEGGEGGVARALMRARAELAALRPEEAELACRTALELARRDRLSDASELVIEALSLRADVADRLGPREAQLEALGELLTRLPERDARRIPIEARRFWTLTRIGDPSFESDGERLVVRAKAVGQSRVAAEVAVHLAIVASQRGDQDRAERILREAREGLAQTPETLALRARIANNLGNVFAYRGAHAPASESYAEALRMKREEGDPVGQRIALGNLALMSLALGQPARAIEDLVKSLTLARQTGHRRGEAWSLLTLAEVGLEGASPRYARRRAEAAAAIAQGLGDQLVEGDARTTLAEALWQLGEIELARGEAERGRALAEAARNRWTSARATLIGLLARYRGARPDEREAIAEAVGRLAIGDGDAAGADATTRLMARRHAAEHALLCGDTPGALALVGHAEGAPRGGIRWFELLHTRLRVHRAVASPEADAIAARAGAEVARWLDAWPEAPLADGVDDAALTEGPCRHRLDAHAIVASLLDAGHRCDTRGGSVDVPADVTGGVVLSEAATALASLAVGELDRVIAQQLVGVVRRLEAERAFLVRERGPSDVSIVEARDADGEAIGEARKRLPEVVVEAALRGEPWRAPGPEGKGAIAVVPWRVPLGDGQVRGALVLQNRFSAGAFADAASLAAAVAELALPLRLRTLEGALAEAQAQVDKVQSEASAAIARTTEEIRSLRKELESTREQLGPARDYPEIVFTSPAMKRMLRQVDRVVATDLPVHIHGESGTGKELVARAIHQLGARAKGPFVPQNCTAIPPTLFESELFGHERGAFTGAMRSTEGLFRRAHGGTLFLDEIGDLPLELQAKLLRVLETGEVRPVGANRSVSVDVRIVSATHRDLIDLIRKGTFREDLYYRLNVIRIDVPPLRERPEDIPVLVRHFIARRTPRGEPEPTVDDAAMRALVRFGWPGNVRQLENEIARATLLAEGGVVTPRDLSPDVAAARGREASAPGGAKEGATGGATLASLGLAAGTLKDRVDRLEALALEAALREAQGNKSEVARVLGLSRAGLNLKLKRLGLWDNVD